MLKTHYCLSISILIAFVFAACSYGQPPKAPLWAGIRIESAVADAEFAYRWCPAGEFKMGASENARREYGDRFVSQHEVRISSGFWMQETEVTQMQYEKVMGQRPVFWQISLQSDDIYKHPVEQITWFDAIEYCKRLSKLDSANDYRLPTAYRGRVGICVSSWDHDCALR